MGKHVDDLTYSIRYQIFSPPITTTGMCLRDCGTGSRGGNVCTICLTEDLSKIVGEKRATEYIEACRRFHEATVILKEEPIA